MKATEKRRQYINNADKLYNTMRARLGSGSGIWGEQAIEAKKFFRDADTYARQYGMTTTRFFREICLVSGC